MCGRAHRVVACVGVLAIGIASVAIERARAESQSAAQSAVDSVPSQDFAGADAIAAEPNTRVAQFFPFSLFEQRPQARPRYAPPPRVDNRTIYRRQSEDDRRIYRRQSEDDGTVTRLPKITRHSPTESLKEKIVTELRNPPPIPPTHGPLLLTVSVAKQTITLYDGGVPVAKAPVSTGTVERPTPMGVFSVVEKSWWHRSNMYSAAPMPYMQRITWSGVALHAGELPGYRASHGCIRLPDSFALRLWYTTRVGARVIVAWNELTPLEIDHPLLFQPAPPPAPPRPDEAVVSMNDPAAVPSQDDPADHADRFAIAGSPDATGQDTASVEEQPELDHMMLAAVDDGAGLFDEPVATADAGDAVDDGGLPLIPAKLVVTDILRPKPAVGVFAIARHKAKAAKRVKTAPAAEIEAEAVLRPGPISVLISRKDRKIYVRKGLQPVFAMPVTIAEPERPLGTHVFTAVAANQDGSQLSWTVVSPSSEPATRAALSHPTAAASAALDRISLPQAATDRITQLLSVGATLIVSDAGLGRTANLLDSDFTVLLRPEVIAARSAPSPRRWSAETLFR